MTSPALIPLELIQNSMHVFLSEHPVLSAYYRNHQCRIDLKFVHASCIQLQLLWISDDLRQLGLNPSAGTQIMNRLCELCDQHHQSLQLFARPLPKVPSAEYPVPISLSKLIEFYQHFGLEPHFDQSSKVSCFMKRYPVSPLSSFRVIRSP